MHFFIYVFLSIFGFHLSTSAHNIIINKITINNNNDTNSFEKSCSLQKSFTLSVDGQFVMFTPSMEFIRGSIFGPKVLPTLFFHFFFFFFFFFFSFSSFSFFSFSLSFSFSFSPPPSSSSFSLFLTSFF